MSMRIGMLTQWFEPEPGPAALPGMLARGLRARGHDVRVVTGFPSYPTGRIADGYRQRRRRDESLGGVRVRRVACYPSHDRSAVRRLASYSSFAGSAVVSGMAPLRDVDVVWVNYSPVTIGLPMFVQHWRRGTPLVVHVLDLWPDTLAASGFAPAGRIGRAAQAGLERWCGAMYRRADTVAYISPGVRDVLADRGVPPEKLAYAPMWADEAAFAPTSPAVDRSSWKLGPDTIALVYAGSLGGAQDLSTLVRACARVRDLDLRCLVAGSGTEETALRALSARVGATNVEFLGRLDRDDLTRLMAASDVQYVGLNAHPLASLTMPSKIQAVLASGRAIVGSLEGDPSHVVRRAGGWTVRPGDVGGLEAAIREAWAHGRSGLAEAGARARWLYDQEFSMARGIDRIEGLLSRAAGRP